MPDDLRMLDDLLLPVARQVVDAAAIRAGDGVVDVGTGTGIAAVQAAARGAHVTGVDADPARLDLAFQRSAAARADVEWTLADATLLPFGDRTFDVVLSVFGLADRPDQRATAAELARIGVRDARVVLAVWTCGTQQPPPGSRADAAAVTALLADVGVRVVTATRHTRPLPCADPAQAADLLIAAGHPRARDGAGIVRPPEYLLVTAVNAGR